MQLILVGDDGSSAAAHAVEWATRLAEERAAGLLLVHVTATEESTRSEERVARVTSPRQPSCVRDHGDGGRPGCRPHRAWAPREWRISLAADRDHRPPRRGRERASGGRGTARRDLNERPTRAASCGWSRRPPGVGDSRCLVERGNGRTPTSPLSKRLSSPRLWHSSTMEPTPRSTTARTRARSHFCASTGANRSSTQASASTLSSRTAGRQKYCSTPRGRSMRTSSSSDVATTIRFAARSAASANASSRMRHALQ